MSLPNPSMSFSPFAILTAEEMNDIVENIESLSAGTGFNTGALDGSVVLQDNSVPEVKTVVKQSYSTSEVNTGAKWIDNKAIYKKTVSIGALPNATTKNIAHGSTGIDKIISITGFAYNATPSFINLPHPFWDAPWSIVATSDTTNIIIVTNRNYSDYTGYITLVYTK